jgi:hypothetical protein
VNDPVSGPATPPTGGGGVVHVLGSTCDVDGANAGGAFGEKCTDTRRGRTLDAPAS